VLDGVVLPTAVAPHPRLGNTRVDYGIGHWNDWLSM
jgi:hypothetical protein